MRADVETLQAQVVHQIPPRIQGLESRGLGLELRVQSPEYDGKGNSFGLLEVNFSFFIFFCISLFLSFFLSLSLLFFLFYHPISSFLLSFCCFSSFLKIFLRFFFLFFLLVNSYLLFLFFVLLLSFLGFLLRLPSLASFLPSFISSFASFLHFQSSLASFYGFLPSFLPSLTSCLSWFPSFLPSSLPSFLAWLHSLFAQLVYKFLTFLLFFINPYILIVTAVPFFIVHILQRRLEQTVSEVSRLRDERTRLMDVGNELRAALNRVSTLISVFIKLLRFC